MQKHQETHSENRERKYKCDLCDAKFFTPQYRYVSIFMLSAPPPPEKKKIKKKNETNKAKTKKT